MDIRPIPATPSAERLYAADNQHRVDKEKPAGDAKDDSQRDEQQPPPQHERDEPKDILQLSDALYEEEIEGLHYAVVRSAADRPTETPDHFTPHRLDVQV